MPSSRVGYFQVVRSRTNNRDKPKLIYRVQISRVLFSKFTDHFYVDVVWKGVKFDKGNFLVTVFEFPDRPRSDYTLALERVLAGL